MKLLLSLFSLASILIAYGASAEPGPKDVPYFKECHTPPDAAEIRAIHYPPGVPNPRAQVALNDIIHIHIKETDLYFNIPAGYAWWAWKRDLDVMHERKTLVFSFVMPSKGYVVESSLYPPGEGAYHVHVDELRFLKEPPPPTVSGKDFFKGQREIVTPEQMYINSINGLSDRVRNRRETPAFGLIQVAFSSEEEIKQINQTGTRYLSEIEYRNIPGTDPQLFLNCDCLALKNMRVRSCRGDVLFKKEKMTVRLHFPHEAMPHWADILKTIQEFIHTWRVPPPEEKPPLPP